jgi:toxin ParE1/3/4
VKRFRLSKAAENDMRRIWREGNKEHGEARAELYLRGLDQCFHLIGEYPSMGHRCEDLRAGYRCFPKGEHNIYYRLERDGVLIVRIRPQRMLPRKPMLDEGGARP